MLHQVIEMSSQEVSSNNELMNSHFNRL